MKNKVLKKHDLIKVLGLSVSMRDAGLVIGQTYEVGSIKIDQETEPVEILVIRGPQSTVPLTWPSGALTDHAECVSKVHCPVVLSRGMTL